MTDTTQDRRRHDEPNALDRVDAYLAGAQNTFIREVLKLIDQAEEEEIDSDEFLDMVSLAANTMLMAPMRAPSALTLPVEDADED